MATANGPGPQSSTAAALRPCKVTDEGLFTSTIAADCLGGGTDSDTRVAVPEPLFDDIGDSLAVGPANFEYTRAGGRMFQIAYDSGSASVWLAHDTFTGHPVVVKAAPISSTAQYRLNRELRVIEGVMSRMSDVTASRCSFPKVLWAGESQTSLGNNAAQSRYFTIVTECEGPDLNRLLELHGHFSLRTVVNIGVQLLHSLETLHQAGFVHGGIKPQNVVAGGPQHPDKVVLIDFDSGRGTTVSTQTRPYASATRICETAFDYGYAEDVIALSYMLLRFLRGRRGLPWEYLEDTVGWRLRTLTSRAWVIDRIACLKRDISVDALCAGLPPAFETFMRLAQKSRPHDDGDGDRNVRYLRDPEGTCDIDYKGMRSALTACLEDADSESHSSSPGSFDADGRTAPRRELAPSSIAAQLARIAVEASENGPAYSQYMNADELREARALVDASDVATMRLKAQEEFVRDNIVAAAGAEADVEPPLDEVTAWVSLLACADLDVEPLAYDPDDVATLPPLDWTPLTGTHESQLAALDASDGSRFTKSIAGVRYLMPQPSTEYARALFTIHGEITVDSSP